MEDSGVALVMTIAGIDAEGVIIVKYSCAEPSD